MSDKKNNKNEIKGWIKRAKNGETEAFGFIYDSYLPKIYRFILIKVSNRADAEDLSQRVFMKAWESIPKFEDKKVPFSAWLYRIARNSVIDFYRTKKSSSELEENLSVGDDRATLDDKILLDQSGERILSAINYLTDDQRDVIVLRFIDDLSYKEIASIMNKNSSALRILQHRAINKLRKILDKELFD